MEKKPHSPPKPKRNPTPGIQGDGFDVRFSDEPREPVVPLPRPPDEVLPDGEAPGLISTYLPRIAILGPLPGEDPWDPEDTLLTAHASQFTP